MEVNDMRKPQTVPFCMIESGKVFIDEYNDIMMKLEHNDSSYNAVDLKNGYVYTYRADQIVTPINRASINIYD